MTRNCLNVMRKIAAAQDYQMRMPAPTQAELQGAMLDVNKRRLNNGLPMYTSRYNPGTPAAPVAPQKPSQGYARMLYNRSRDFINNVKDRYAQSSLKPALSRLIYGNPGPAKVVEAKYPQNARELWEELQKTMPTNPEQGDENIFNQIRKNTPTGY